MIPKLKKNLDTKIYKTVNTLQKFVTSNFIRNQSSKNSRKSWFYYTYNGENNDTVFTDS